MRAGRASRSRPCSIAPASDRNAVQVALRRLDGPVLDGTPDFAKALDVDHARDGEVMLAWAMNGADLPFLNGYPLRLVVPGYYGTYWVKHLSAITASGQAARQFLDEQGLSHPRQRLQLRHAGQRPRQRRGRSGGSRSAASSPRSRTARSVTAGEPLAPARHRVRRRQWHQAGPAVAGRRPALGRMRPWVRIWADIVPTPGRPRSRSRLDRTPCRSAPSPMTARPSRCSSRGTRPATCAV